MEAPSCEKIYRESPFSEKNQSEVLVIERSSLELDPQPSGSNSCPKSMKHKVSLEDSFMQKS